LSGPGELRVGAKVDGTLNAWRDTDRGWTVELAVPRSDLESIGDVVGPDTEWRLLVGRYNYGKSIESVELTGWPKQPKTDFHGYEHYGVVRFQQPATR
jgi:hypothetical protein